MVYYISVRVPAYPGEFARARSLFETTLA